MDESFWPQAICFLVGAGVFGFLTVESGWWTVSATHAALATVLGGLTGLFIGDLVVEKRLE